jgi:hypothetical protein
MSTAILTPGETRWGHPPDKELAMVAENLRAASLLNRGSMPSETEGSKPVAAPEEDSIQIRTVSHASWLRRPDETMAAAPLERIMDKFVELVTDNPKVWAVYATQDPTGITVWTYVDSADRNDLSPVYEAEWQLLNMYPEVGFDFNTALVPAGHEQFDEGEKVYLYRR